MKRERERKNSSCRQRGGEKNNIIKFKHGFLKSVTLWFFFFKEPSSEPTDAFPKGEINIDNKKAGPFCFVCFSFFHLCGGGRISGAGDSFDKPPRLSTQAHVKPSQLWLRSLHTIATRGTKGPPPPTHTHTPHTPNKRGEKIVGS